MKGMLQYEGRLTLHIQSEVDCSAPCLVVAHHLVHSTVTPGGAGDGDGADRGGYPTTTGDDFSISGPGEVGGSWFSFKPKEDSEAKSFQHSIGLVWDRIEVIWWVYCACDRKYTLTVNQSSL